MWSSERLADEWLEKNSFGRVCAVVPPELRQRKDGSKVCLDVSYLALQDGVEVYARVGIQRLDYMYSF